MAIQGNLYVCQLDDALKSIKWMILGDTQGRIDLIRSEFVLYEEMAETTGYRRVQEIVEENGMFCLGPEPTEIPALLGGKGFHIAFFHPHLKGLEASEMPRMMENIPTG
ncbi:hypothetical protein [Mycobacteroides abscessus]|uniref:Uncharacterized protein n=1 Tax=Mycobacteroides abscessus TaxID=36809 RepID=A0A0U0ZK22_9MYCO|nr:hypothetical protein [Mycobacteroides abscessus]SKS10287.1 Uncharacterised protein [Mycobacteroides abscessus subsp. abscessus]MBL3733208.1 hypothetical protein [Mycobacteroides abscessus subsp. massiliense]MBL3747832.1 hypothetical protein [Mycobacteroides abscessus subsp. massiliense]MBN7478971.1 hypothetical protein [Mycobacteroides abscessus subsp. massiliense]MDM2103184.1 hypothetical protein [Mycobacteroides abscessus]